jgi:hypothetical protein
VKKHLSFLIVVLLGILTQQDAAQSQVREQWAERIFGTQHNEDDSPVGVQSDSAGNVYIVGVTYNRHTGADYTIVKYTPEGTLIWSRYYDHNNGEEIPSDFILDNQSNLYITGCGSGDFLTIKYDSLGNLLWEARYNGGYSNAIVQDPQGNIYVTGYSGTLISDYVTIKYNSLGVQQWVVAYSGPGVNSNDRAVDIGIDAQGNIFVTGNSTHGYDAGHYVTVMYDTQGVRQWVAQFAGPSDESFPPCGLALDAQGNIYVAGNRSGNGSWANDYIVIKYNPAGVQQWYARYDCPEPVSDERAEGLAVDADGNVVVTGTVFLPQGSNAPCQYLTVKYNSSGILQWTGRDNPNWPGANYAFGLALDNNRNVYITGLTWYSTYEECYTIKYDPQGHHIWTASHQVDSLESFGGTEGDVISADQAGNIYVGGRIRLGGGVIDDDIHVIKYQQLPVESMIEASQTIPVQPNQIGLSASPNPFNPTTAISYQLSAVSFVNLSVYDISGRKVAELVNGMRDAGSHSVTFDGSGLASGIYLYRLTAGDFSAVQKLVLLK